MLHMPYCPEEIPMSEPLRVLRDGEIAPQFRILLDIGSQAIADDNADLIGAVYEALAFIGPDDEIEADRYSFAVDKIAAFSGMAI